MGKRRNIRLYTYKELFEFILYTYQKVLQGVLNGYPVKLR